MKKKQINTRIFTNRISKTWFFCRMGLCGGFYLLPTFWCGTYFKHRFCLFFKTQNMHYFNRYFDIKASCASIKNWCDPCHLQESHALFWHAKVGVYSYSLWHFLFLTDWLLRYKLFYVHSNHCRHWHRKQI